MLASMSRRFGWVAARRGLLLAASALFVCLMVSMTLAGRHGVVSEDLASYLAPAVAIVRGTGAPYVNYFDVKPPGLIFFFVPWIALFGWSMKSLVVLDVLLLSADMALYYYLLRRVAPPGLRDAVYAVSLVAAFGLQLFGGMFLISESIGSLLLLLALALALRFRSRPFAFLLIGALCALAGQVKEVWFFSVIPFGVLALQVGAVRWRTVACLAAGWAVMLGLIVGGLFAIGAQHAYWDVLQYKATAFPLPGLKEALKGLVTTVRSESSLVFLLWPAFPIVVGWAVYLRVRVLGFSAAFRELLSFNDSFLTLSFLTWACLVVGYVWQDKPVRGHSFVMLFIPFLLLTAAGLVYVGHALSNSKSRDFLRRGRTAAIVIGLVLIPSTSVLTGIGDRYDEFRASDQVSAVATLEDAASTAKYAVMASHLRGTGCLQVAYGWNSGAAYMYTGANPCSRYFLANLLTTDKVREEFRHDMTAMPPDVIVYETDMADLDVAAFEKTVFPYSSVLANCYKPTDTPTVFVALYDPTVQSRCIADELLAGGWES